MNYVELELGGEKRGAKLGIGFLKSVTDAKQITLDELFSSISGANAVFIIPELIYYSLKYNSQRKKEEFNIDMYDIFDWIDDAGGFNSKVYVDFSEALTQSLGVDVGKTQPQKKVAKK